MVARLNRPQKLDTFWGSVQMLNDLFFLRDLICDIIPQTWGLLRVMDHPRLQLFHVWEVQVLAWEAH